MFSEFMLYAIEKVVKCQRHCLRRYVDDECGLNNFGK